MRRARAGEADRLTAIARAAKAHWGYSAAWLDAWRAELTITESDLAAGTVLVAELPEGAAAGFAAVTREAAGWSLAHLWVRPEAHRRGIGRALVRAALDVVAQAAPGALVIVIADPHAAPFYRRVGGRAAGAVPAPMPGAPDRVLPRFELRAPG